ncbi:hypothetical protein JCM33374_g4478 [Metschnikowia sp. JCM 33374]|nr:hypothetical protein JCM33374_g4478 [Metschnikowia sp. JCM 33374]
MVALKFSDVVVELKENASQNPKYPKHPTPTDLPQLAEEISILVPKFAYEFLFKTNLLNELSIHFYQVSFYHHAIHDAVSLHLDYIKIENTGDTEKATEKLTVSILDGCVNDTSEGSQVAGLRLFHNLEVCIKCDTVFSCPRQDSTLLEVKLSNVEVLLVLTDLRIRKLAHLLEKKKRRKSSQSKSPDLPSLRDVLAKLHLISSLSLKIDQSEVSFKEVKIVSSSYSLNYSRDRSYKKQTVAKVSSYVTAAKIYHLDSQCMNLPSLTYLLDIDVSDFCRASNSENKDSFTVDLFTTLSMTNPSFFVYFDQLAYLLDIAATGNSSKSSQTFSPTNSFMDYLMHVRKTSIKFIVVDSQAQLHMPNEETDKFSRLALDNVVSNVGSHVFAFKFSSKHLSNILSGRCSSSKPVTLKSFIKIRNMYLEVEENKILLSALSGLIGYRLDSHKIALRISTKRLQIKSVNTMIFDVIRRVREAGITSSNRACAKMNTEKREGSSHNSGATEETKREYLDIFEILPPIIHSIRFRAAFFSSYIICNDCLPSHIIHDELSGQDIDLAEFKRGVSFSASGLELDYKTREQIFETRLKQVQINTLSECSSEYADDFDSRNTDPLGDFDVSDTSSLESGLSGFSNFESHENVKTVKKVLNVEDIILSNPSGSRNKLLLSIPAIEGRADIYLVWCILYAYTLVEMISPQVERTYSKEQAARLHGVSKIVDLDVEIASLSVVTRLPHEVDVLFEIDNLYLKNALVSPHCKISFVRLYVVHPTTKLWSRLVSISDTDVDLDFVTRNSVLLKSRAIRFNIPFQFLVYTVIDNAITFVKAATQIKLNFKHLSRNIHDYSRIKPKATEALKIPRIQLKSGILGVTLENDDFESQLALIYEFGAIENVERRRKLAAFEKKAEALRSQTREALSETHVEKRRFIRRESERRHVNVLSKAFLNTTGDDERESTTKHAKKSSLRDTFCGNRSENDAHESSKTTKMSILRETFGVGDSKTSSTRKNTNDSADGSNENYTASEDTPDHRKSRLTEEETENLIAEAYENLLRDFSSSWVNKFDRYKSAYHNSWKKRMEDIWGSDSVNKLMKSKFDIQEYSRGPPQFQGVFRDLNLIVDDPHLDDVDEFLKKYGKGQPRLDYSILLPAYIHLRSSSVYMSLRDYALPFISFPSSGDPDFPVMDLKGTFVVNEKLVEIPEELRHIFVPFSPATKSSRIVDNFYSVSVIRTLTPVKVMFDLESTLNTDRACVVSWCKSYQPALSSAMMAFENFTKPEIDDSPLGWWDKMALTAHGKVKFNIRNELCLHMKSSISPYSLIGNSSGLVFCWKNNVSLRINDTGKQSELVILDSDGFILGIPNYSATEGRAWSLMNSIANEDQIDGNTETNKFQKRVMKLSSDEKVVWKLGFLFERNKDKNSKELSADMERTNQFKNHYDVSVTGPQYEYHPDSYEEFRSDYLHLAMSVNSSSKQGNSHNFAYFTPLTIEYFKVWWKTLNDNVSLPIREGKLFAKSAFDESSVKFGPHLFTLKYQLVLEPLTVSDTYLASGGKETGHNVISYGLKAKASKCIIDLHQRREIARYVNEKLGIDKKVRELKMNLGEVEVSDADVRLILAQFTDISMTGKLLSYYSGETSQLVDLDTYEDEIKEQNMKRNQTPKNHLLGEEEDFSWIDFDDFIEMEEDDILSPDPTIKVIPMFNTPRFTYFREFTLEDPEGPHPFGYEPSHNCLIGMNTPDEVQGQLVSLRSNQVKLKLDEYIKKSQSFTHSANSNTENDKSRLENDIAYWKKKANHIHKLREKYSNSSYDSNINEISKANSRSNSMSDMKSQVTRAISIYSTISSLDQAREVINANSLLSKYHNRFLIHNMKLKWNNEVRDVFTSFLSVASHRKTEMLSMSRKALDLMDQLMKSSELKKERPTREPSFVYENNFTCGNDVIDAFEEYLSTLEGDNEEIEPNYIVKFIKPQVHFQSDANPKACVLMTAKDIELRVLSVKNEGTDDIITESEQKNSLLETRYGVLCRDARVFTFEEEDFPIKSKSPYGAENNHEIWPPWLNVEDGDVVEDFENNLVFERNTMALSLKKPNVFAIDTSKSDPRKSELVVHIAKLVINATSIQYCAFYFILTDLLIHGSQKSYFLQRIEQISSVSEASDFANLADKVKLLQNNIRICKFLILKMNQKSLKLSEEKRRQNSHLKLELCRMKIELGIITKSLEAKISNYSGLQAMSSTWKVHVDQIIFHILDDNRKPLIDFGFATSTFTRLEEADGSNANSVEVSLIQGFNLQSQAVYPELLRPFIEDKNGKSPETYDSRNPMIKMNWKMLNPVGGIRVMSNADLSIQPMHIQLDFDTATDLFNYLFPKDEESHHSGKETTESKKEIPSMDASETETGYESNESPSSLSSPSRSFKKLWHRNVSHKSETTSSFTRSSSFRDTFSGESVSVTSSENPIGTDETSHRKRIKKSTKEARTPDDISVIMNRSANYFVVGDFKVKQMKLCISFKAPKHLNIIDVHNLEFSLPSIHYQDKTWTSNDFVLQLKKDVVKIFLANTGKIIGNKFKLKKRKKAVTPLRQISDFSHYVALTDLQEDTTSIGPENGYAFDSTSPTTPKTTRGSFHQLDKGSHPENGNSNGNVKSPAQSE